ncbi:MFS family permease [Streptomyces sp. SAI-126]|uniref:MFS transporter n=1 Tax=Streptomyces sp. SAI-126 TaxID=3377732 RepID=UPI003C7B7F32
MKPSPTASAGSTVRTPRKWGSAGWGLLLVLAGNMLIDSLEVSMMIVVLPSVGQALGLPLTVVQGLVTGFALGFGALLLFGGRVVELLGRRRVYLAALLGFAVASVAGGMADGPVVLIATRVVKGFCVALTAPTGLAILTTEFREGPARRRAVSVYTLVAACGFAGGLVVSGLLTGTSWRAVFLFPAPVVLLLFVLGLRLIPADPAQGQARRRYDLAGAATLLGALAALTVGIVSVPERGWTGSPTLGAFVAAVLLLTIFVRVERSSADPLVGSRVLAHGALLRSMLGAAALNGSYLGLLLLATVQLQTAEGWSPPHTALAFLPASLPLVLTAPVSGRLISRFGTRRLVALGAVGPPVGYALYLRALHPGTAYVTDVLPTMLLVGAGFALGFAALNVQAATEVPERDRSAAIGLYQTAVQTAAVLVPAVVGALLTSGGDRPALWLVTALGVLGLAVAVSGLRRRPTAGPASLDEQRS